MVKLNWDHVAEITVGILIAEALILLHKKFHSVTSDSDGIEL